MFTSFNWIKICLILFSKFAVCDAANSAKSVGTQLVWDILGGYDAKVKPTFNHRKAINVTFRPDLYLIVDVNERQQSITLSMWISEQWEDELLFWDPEKYNGISRVTLPYDPVWMPDTVLYNSLIMEDDETRRTLNVQIDTVLIRNTTIVKFNYPSMMTFSCHLNVLYFPFDSQNCTMIFGSWTYDNAAVDYHYSSQQVSIKNFVQNAGWDLINFTAERVVSKYDCCPEEWTTINLHIHISRKPLFYIINLIIPSLIISLISIIGLFTPSSSTGERNEKVTLGITTLLAMSILLLMVSDQMPTTSSYVPMIGWLFLFIIILISIASLLTTVIIQIHQKGLEGERISEPLKKCGLWWSKLLRVRIPRHFNQKHKRSIPSQLVRPLILPSASFVKMGPNAFTHPMDKYEDEIDNFEQMAEQEKQMALVEWEWLASVIEKGSCFACLLFLFVITAGIYISGWLHF